MKNLPGVVVCICLVWMTVACQSIGTTSGYYDPPLAAGSELEIRQAIVVPAGYARVYLQAGRTMTYAATDQYAPFCFLLMRQPLPVAQTIAPGTFLVEKVYLLETDVSRELPLSVATNGFLAHDGRRGLLAFQVHVKLFAAAQPDVDALVCSGAFAAPAEAEPIRLPELQRVLGAFGVLRATPSRIVDH